MAAGVQVGEKLPFNCHGGDARGLGNEFKGLTVAAGDKVAGAVGVISAATDSLVRPISAQGVLCLQTSGVS